MKKSAIVRKANGETLRLQHGPCWILAAVYRVKTGYSWHCPGCGHHIFFYLPDQVDAGVYTCPHGSMWLPTKLLGSSTYCNICKIREFTGAGNPRPDTIDLPPQKQAQRTERPSLSVD